MALQPFIGPWPLLQFPNLFYTDGRTPWTGDQSVYTQDNTNTDIHALSGILTQAGEVSSCVTLRSRCDRLL
jgi:hypothetical protein